jgi:hypothetical protein
LTVRALEVVISRGEGIKSLAVKRAQAHDLVIVVGCDFLTHSCFPMNIYHSHTPCAVTGGIVGGALFLALLASIVLASRYLKCFKDKFEKVACFAQRLISVSY